MSFIGINDEEFSNSDADDDDLLHADLEALRKACMRPDGNDDDNTSAHNADAAANFGGMDESDDSNDTDNVDFLKSLREKLKVSEVFNKTISTKPLSDMLPDGGVSDDDDDGDNEAIETLRAIQRRFAAYDSSVDALNSSRVHNYQRPEQVRASSIPLEKETSNNLIVHRTNACEGFPDFEDNCAIPGNSKLMSDSVYSTQTMDQFGWDKINDCQLLSLPPKSSNFPKAAQVFIDAIRKNRSCQKLIRSKLAQIETRIEVNQKLMQHVKIFKDFQIVCKRRSGRALSQKKDPRVQLFTAPKVGPLKHSKSNDRNVSPLSYGPEENSHVVNYRMVLKNSPLSFCRPRWSTAEREAIGKGLRQEYQKTLLEKSVEFLRGSDNIDNIMASIKNLEITGDNIRLFLQHVNWNYFASIYVKGRSGTECEARWLNHEDPVINHNPWTHEEDKILRMIVQERGLNNCIDIAISLGTNRTPFQCLARYQRSLNPWIMKREWTKDEDAQLCAAVEVIGESKWQTVASTLEGRTGTQCSNRWKKSLNPAKSQRGTWDPDEDLRLKVAVMLFGPKTWRRIASFVPGRTDVQCRERWVNCLDPSLKMSAWTKDEDKRLLEAVEVHNYVWAKVASCVPPRTDNQCLRRWQRLCPAEKPKRQAIRRIRQMALTSNFVDRESERPNLRPEDFLPFPMLNSAADCVKMNTSTKSKRKSREITQKTRLIKPRKNFKTSLKKVSDIASPEVFDPNAESSLLMIEHASTSNMSPEQHSILTEPSACQNSHSESQTVDDVHAESSIIKKKQGPKRKAVTKRSAPETNSKKTKRLKIGVQPSAGQNSLLLSENSNGVHAETSSSMLLGQHSIPIEPSAGQKSPLQSQMNDGACAESSSNMSFQQHLTSIEPSANQNTLLQSETIDGAHAETSIIKKKQGPKQKAAVDKSAPKTNFKKTKGIKERVEQSPLLLPHQTSQSINGNAVKAPERNITSVIKERASNQHGAVDSNSQNHPDEQVCTEIAVNNNTHQLTTQSLESDPAGLHEELDRLLSLNLSWEIP